MCKGRSPVKGFGGKSVHMVVKRANVYMMGRIWCKKP